MRPADGLISPISSRSNVDLPHPFGADERDFVALRDRKVDA
jgi:hypothetical protein